MSSKSEKYVIVNKFLIKFKRVPPKKINLSYTFPVRARCAKCLKGPTNYYYLRPFPLFINPKDELNSYLEYKKFIKRMGHQYFLMDDPSSFTKSSIYFHKPAYKSVCVRAHKNKNIGLMRNGAEYVECECGHTSWTFSQKSASTMPEIKNRKSKNFHPIKLFVY